MNTFNPQQQEVIRAWGGYHLVLAPPGCGKTAVLAERVVWAFQQHGLSLSDMACLTFTNRAARGMRQRISERCGGQDTDALFDQLYVGNVHRFCSRFLFDAGVVPENTTVIDTDTSISIIADYLGEDELKVLGEAKHRQRYSQVINLQHLLYQCCHGYPSQLMVHREALPPAILRELCTAFSLSYSQASTIDLYRHADYYRDQHALLSSEAMWMLEALYAARCYEHYKQTNDLFDFEDLLLRSYDVMATPSAPYASQKFKWIQVDEVQDLNPLQLAIIDLFTAPEATVVYLGDAQQAIFSFMGAQTDTLELLRQRCGPHGLHNFCQNYRSPDYLLQLFNTFAQQQLGISPQLLPTTQNHTPLQSGHLVLSDCDTNIDEVNWVVRAVARLRQLHPEETVAVVVAFNSDADEVSTALTAGGVDHFKISGTDLFTTPTVRLLLSHLGVLSFEHDFIAWAQILSGLHVFSSLSASRRFVGALMSLGISPADLLAFDGSTSVAAFVSDWQTADLVIFDTETTGLSVADDDVVQLAAVRVRQGMVVDSLNLFIETQKTIPHMLGDVVNPLVEEYRLQPHLTHAEALERFLRFAQGAQLVAHNATFDYQIMRFQLQRYAPHLPAMEQLWPHYHDTLKLARLLCPRLPRYKLKSLIEHLGLEGQNSHLASDDIMATLSLADKLYCLGHDRVGQQLEFLSRHQRSVSKLRQLYGPLYHASLQALYTLMPATAGNPLVQLIETSYAYLISEGFVAEEPKMKYIIGYVEELTAILADATSRSPMLADVLHSQMNNLSTLKESDLIGTRSMDQQVFVSTVHKAKGLEFDTVIVYDAVEGKYPSAYAAVDSDEEARKFYVAISRARRRLVITFCRNSISRWGRCYSKQLTPYMDCLRHYFATQ